MLLHPEAERALRAVMLPVPIVEQAREEWAVEAIFRRRGRGGPWNESSYIKAWWHAVDAAKDEHPEVAGMWLRDLRKVAKTRTRDGLNWSPLRSAGTARVQSSSPQDGQAGAEPGRPATR